MIYDKPNIAQILKKYLHEHHNTIGIGTDDLLEEIGLDAVAEIDFEEFICDKFRLGELYINLRKLLTFGDLVKHIYLMRFYRSIVLRELNTGVRFYCLIIDGFTYEIFHKKPSFFRYFKAFLSGEKFIYSDIIKYTPT